ncbi:hypothetical protein G4B88_002275 [Cannabis sativa]|uniref:Uncharacterized protein n=1 Tax=Cannabis sativa TaxID=3483 RepID=A0A7J6DJ66_CANSA|nr:hypothetical protein G4B88_002275 [Cannabis sativa]
MKAMKNSTNAAQQQHQHQFPKENSGKGKKTKNKMDMFGGDNSTSPLFPALVEENSFSILPMHSLSCNYLQITIKGGNEEPLLLHLNSNPTPTPPLSSLFWGVVSHESMSPFFTDTGGCNVGQMNHMANKHIASTDLPNHRRLPETDSNLIKLVIWKHFEPKPVSTGLKLSYEEEEHNSSVTSASENLKAVLPVISSVNDNLKVEIDRQKEEFDQFIKAQFVKFQGNVSTIHGREDLQGCNGDEAKTDSFLSKRSRKGVTRKLHEKETEVENMNRRNKELMDRIKQITVEVQTWHYKAKYNESVINFLKSNLQQVIAQGAIHVKERVRGQRGR